VSDSLEALKQELTYANARLKELTEPEEEPERDPERELAEGLRAELNRSRTRWYTPDELGKDDDGPQAA
jgi:hypothetical protein